MLLLFFCFFFTGPYSCPLVSLFILYCNGRYLWSQRDTHSKHTCLISSSHYPDLVKLKCFLEQKKNKLLLTGNVIPGGQQTINYHLPDCPDCCCLPGLSPAPPQWETPGSLYLRSAGPERSVLLVPAIVSHHPSLLPNPLGCNWWCTREAFKSISPTSWTFHQSASMHRAHKCLTLSI